jgi:hypothetical protein
MNVLVDGISWFPESWAYGFYICKGALSLLGTLLLLKNMDVEWSAPAMSLGRRLRYLSLLTFAVVMTGASVEQATQDAVVNYRNLGAFVAAVVLVVAMVVSLRETRHH